VMSTRWTLVFGDMQWMTGVFWTFRMIAVEGFTLPHSWKRKATIRESAPMVLHRLAGT